MVIQPTAQQVAAMQTYANVLQEIRGRLWLLDNLIAGDKGENSHYTKEFCYLQLRMICELIALGCLVAHGDIEETGKKAIRKESSASNLMKVLAELHPNFYPVPVKAYKISPTEWRQDELQSGFLTKDDLSQLYGQCGNALHRTNLKKYRSNAIVINEDFPLIQSWAVKMARLLDNHRIMISDESGIIFCKMIDFDHPERVFIIWGGRTT